GGDERSSAGSEVFTGDGSQEAEEEIQQRETDGSAEQEDDWADCVQYDRQDEDREAKQRKEEETELEVKARVLLLEVFVGQESRAEDEEERPAHSEAAAAEVEDQKCAEQSAEKELKCV